MKRSIISISGALVTRSPNYSFLVLLILGCLTLAAIPVRAGGGWTPPQGSGFFKLGQNAIIANRYFQPDGAVVDITTISLYTTSVYGEYGITDRLAGVLYAPIFVRSTLNAIEYTSGRDGVPGDYLNSIGDVDVGLKYGLIKIGPVVVSVGLTLGLPLGKTAGGETGILQTGDGEFNQLLTVQASRSMGAFYVSALLGLNNRTNNFSEEFRYGLEVGYSFGGEIKTVMQFRLMGQESFQNGEPTGISNTIFGNNVEYLVMQPAISLEIREKFGITFDGAFAGIGPVVLKGSNILASPNFGLGVYLKF